MPMSHSVATICNRDSLTRAPQSEHRVVDRDIVARSRRDIAMRVVSVRTGSHSVANDTAHDSIDAMPLCVVVGIVRPRANASIETIVRARMCALGCVFDALVRVAVDSK